jgi:hypothetical protein
MGKFVAEDGRAFTDYSPSCTINNKIKKSNNIKNSLEYRKFLQQNAKEIMEVNFQYSVKTTKEVCNCTECIELTKRKFN